MATWYVAKTGSDANTGVNSANAWLTIANATTNASVVAGDTITVGDGSYTENIYPTRGGSAGAGNVILKSTNPLGAKIVGAATGQSVIVPQAHYYTIDGFEITAVANQTEHGVDGGNGGFVGLHHLTVKNCKIHDVIASPGAAASR